MTQDKNNLFEKPKISAEKKKPLLLPGLEKLSVLPVLDRFLSLKTDFVLNRKQKNRSIKVRFFSLQFSMTVYNSYLSRQFTVNLTPCNTLSCLIRLYQG